MWNSRWIIKEFVGNLSLHLLTFVYMYLWDFLPLNPSATTVYLQFMLGLPSNLPSFCILSLTNSRGSRVADRGSRVAGLKKRPKRKSWPTFVFTTSSFCFLSIGPSCITVYDKKCYPELPLFSSSLWIAHKCLGVHSLKNVRYTS